MVDHFHYNFFPIAFSVLLRLESDDFEVESTFGTPFDNLRIETSSSDLL